MKKFLTVGTAAAIGAAGAAAAFVLDPKSGPKRRRAAVERVERGATVVRRESANVLAMIGRDGGNERDSDVTAARVREVLDGLQATGPIAVRVDEGVVTLRGEVTALAAISEAAARVEGLPGVVEVNNLLRLRAAG